MTYNQLLKRVERISNTRQVLDSAAINEQRAQVRLTPQEFVIRDTIAAQRGIRAEDVSQTDILQYLLDQSRAEFEQENAAAEPLKLSQKASSFLRSAVKAIGDYIEQDQQRDQDQEDLSKGNYNWLKQRHPGNRAR